MSETPQFGERQPLTDYADRATAFGVAERDGRVALVRVAKAEREPFYDLPGGALEEGESEAQALAREFGEESGLAVVAEGESFARADQFMIKDDGRPVNNRSAFFIARIQGDAPSLKIEADHELIFVEPEEALSRLRHDSHAWALVRRMQLDGRWPAPDLRPRVIEASLGKGLTPLLGCWAFGGMFLLVGLSAPEPNGSVGAALGAVLLLASLAGLPAIMEPNRLKLDDRGFEVLTRAGSSRTSWRAVERFFVYTPPQRRSPLYTRRLVGYRRVRDPNGILEQLNRMIGQGADALLPAGWSLHPDELAELLNLYRAAYAGPVRTPDT